MLRVTIVGDQIRLQIWLDGEPQVWVFYSPDQIDDLIKQLEAARDAARTPDQA